MIEIGEPRPGQYANVALQPVKGKTAYIGPLSRAALTIMQTAGNQKSYAVVSEAWTIPNRDYWIDMPQLPLTHFNETAKAVLDACSSGLRGTPLSQLNCPDTALLHRGARRIHSPTP